MRLGSILISDVLKGSCWRPPHQPRQDSLSGKTESAFPADSDQQQKNINLLNILEHRGKHLLRRHFRDWADIKLYQVHDMFEVSG